MKYTVSVGSNASSGTASGNQRITVAVPSRSRLLSVVDSPRKPLDSPGDFFREESLILPVPQFGETSNAMKSSLLDVGRFDGV